MNVKIEKKDYNLHVCVTLKSRTRNAPKNACGTKTVLEWLAKNNPEYNIVKTVSGPRHPLHNCTNHLVGEWIFELYQPPKKSVKAAIPKTTLAPTSQQKPARKKTTRKKRKTMATTKKEE